MFLGWVNFILQFLGQFYFSFHTEEKWKNIKNYDELKKETEKIRKKKIEIIKKEHTVAIGVPIFGKNGEIVASLGVYLPKVRFKGENREKIINELKKAGEEITLKLGGKYE